MNSTLAILTRSEEIAAADGVKLAEARSLWTAALEDHTTLDWSQGTRLTAGLRNLVIRDALLIEVVDPGGLPSRGKNADVLGGTWPGPADPQRLAAAAAALRWLLTFTPEGLAGPIFTAAAWVAWKDGNDGKARTMLAAAEALGERSTVATALRVVLDRIARSASR